MAKISLNIYGENDEILKTYETEHIRWRLLTEAVKLDSELKSADTEEQLQAVGNFMQAVFVGMTEEELALADVGDIFNNFALIVKMANKINAPKNA